MQNKPTVYISYQHSSSETIADYIHAQLKRRGIDAFYDDDLAAGADFEAKLHRELINRDFLIVILTPDTVQPPLGPSSGVRQEINDALDQQKHIIPILANGFDRNLFSSIPRPFSTLKKYKWVIFDPLQRDAAIDEIMDALSNQAETSPVVVAPSTPPDPQSKPSRTQLILTSVVVAAIITGTCGVIVALTNGLFGILPIFLQTTTTPTLTYTLTPSETSTSTEVPTQTPTITVTEPPQSTNTLTLVSSPTQVSQATRLPTMASSHTATTQIVNTLAQPTASAGARTYPCEGTIVTSSGATSVRVIHASPSSSAALRPAINVGTGVVITDEEQESSVSRWYRITYPEGSLIGWIPAEYILPSAQCSS